MFEVRDLGDKIGINGIQVIHAIRASFQTCFCAKRRENKTLYLPLELMNENVEEGRNGISGGATREIITLHHHVTELCWR